LESTISTKVVILSKALFYIMTQQAPLGQGLLIIEDSWSHSRHITLDWTPLGKWSARRSPLPD